MSGNNADDGFLGDDYDSRYFHPQGGVTLASPIDQALNLLKDPKVMASLDTLVKESYKFIRLADDLHEIRSYLNDIRVCFIALTVSGYVGILLYALIMCLKRKKNNRRQNDDGGENGSGRYQHRNQRTGSRFENFDMEAAGGMMGHHQTEWGMGGGGGIIEDQQPPPPNGTAIRTPDGYRYKPPNMVRRSSGSGLPPYQQQQQQLQQQRMLNSLDVVDIKSSPGDENFGIPNTGVTMISSASSGSQKEPVDTGFMEKVKN